MNFEKSAHNSSSSDALPHLTRSQKLLLDEIESSLTLNGYAPSYRELMDRFGYKSLGAIHRLVRELQKKGYLNRSSKRSWRSLNPVQRDEKEIRRSREKAANLDQKPEDASVDSRLRYTEIEVIGTVSGSRSPELFLQPWPLVIPTLSQPDKNPYDLYYGLVIQDTSFTSEHLLPGDIIIVYPTEEIMPGELVLATSSHESIIGHFFHEGEFMRFKPSPYSHTTSFFQSKKADAEHTQVWGIIVASLRGFSSAL